MQTLDFVSGLHNYLESLVFVSGYANKENVFYNLNRRLVIIGSRRPLNSKTGHFRSREERERLRIF